MLRLEKIFQVDDSVYINASIFWKSLSIFLSIYIFSISCIFWIFGIELFGMKDKDRPLLQQIGMKMREIRESVWLDVLIREAEKYELYGYSVVCDDVRFVNEAKTLKENGWTVIKLVITDDLQKQRLQDTYGDDWKIHWNNRTDASETEVDAIPLELFDLVIPASNDGSTVKRVIDFL